MRRYFTMWVLLGIMYVAIEVIFSAVTGLEWRLVGQSSIWMFMVGGSLGLVLNAINSGRHNRLPYALRVVLGTVMITAIEFLSGCVLNLWWKFGIWDYSNNPLNFLGQIDIIHSTCWLVLTPFVFWADDVMKHYLGENGRPEPLLSFYTRIFRIQLGPKI